MATILKTVKYWKSRPWMVCELVGLLDDGELYGRETVEAILVEATSPGYTITITVRSEVYGVDENEEK